MHKFKMSVVPQPTHTERACNAQKCRPKKDK